MSNAATELIRCAEFTFYIEVYHGPRQLGSMLEHSFCRHQLYEQSSYSSEVKLRTIVDGVRGAHVAVGKYASVMSRNFV